jgi:hypothetical protein
VRDTYLYVFADGQRISPRGVEIYSNAKATNHITDLHLQKPLPESGHWRFEVHRQITEFFYLPLGTLTLGPREEIWVSPVFTNEFRTSENLGSPPPTHPQD